VTKDGHGDALPDHVALIESAHPVPDERSLAGGRALRRALEDMPKASNLLLLVSGGASSLAEDLTDGHTLDDLAALNTRLLAAGLDIGAMNVERRKISRIKGGQLLAGFNGAQVRMLAISDVQQDDIAVIGSGIGAAPVDAPFSYLPQIVASNTHARTAAAATAQAAGLTVLANTECLYEDVGVLAKTLGAQIRSMDPGALIFGGEPTVVLPKDPGQGGRNQALALELAREISTTTGITVIVGGTDGSDGPTDAAGGIVDGTTWTAGGAEALMRANSGPFLEKRGALLKTGPTGTNVMDLLVVVRI
jgi:hydroxypyruvate reductase